MSTFRPRQPTQVREPGRTRTTNPFKFTGSYVPIQGVPHQKQLRRPQPVRSLDMRVAVVLSVGIHLVAPIAFLVVALVVVNVLGIPLAMLTPKPQPKPQDLEFVLVPPEVPEQPPLNPKTHYRAAHNTQAGGPHSESRPVNLMEPKAAQTPSRPKPLGSTPKPVQQRVSEPQKMVFRSPPTPVQHQVVERPSPVVRPITPEPSPKKAAVDISNLVADYATSNPSESRVAHQALEAIDLNGEAGNKNTPAGVDAVKEPDFGPYMQDLQKRIKQVWHPPRGNESKRVVVIFRVDRLGRLIRVEVTKSSGAPLADRAAVAAIEQIFPFRPLPAEFADENIDIEFTFDYNVFNDKRRSRRS